MSERFKWSERKAQSNLRKHDVDFDEAMTAFDDPLFVVFSDPDHSAEESRFILMGQSTRRRLLVVSYTERGQAIRLISARQATRKERIAYEEEI
ncbi:MAG: BrnT family toxin [Terriglobia bacterium]